MLLPLIGILVVGPSDLPAGSAPPPVAVPHFPDRLHAFVWRNWQLVPAERMARVVAAGTDDIIRMGRAMGLSGPPKITSDQQRRSYITVIRRNWHLLPYDQLLTLLGWTEEKLAYTLREDDFLYVKLGNLKPKCQPIRFQPPNAETRKREAEIGRIVKSEFPAGIGATKEPLFDFVRQLSEPIAKSPPPKTLYPTPRSPLRLCYSYFALYGDPLMDEGADPYPDGYLARLAEVGVNAVWLQGVLNKLAPFPWDSKLSEGYETRLRNLNRLVDRAAKHGICIYLYLNEPRSMPNAFFAAHPALKGVTEGDYSSLCTSSPEVRKYLTGAIASVCRAAPKLGGFFTITASENLTNCWSHHRGEGCPRCGKRSAAEVIAETNRIFADGIEAAESTDSRSKIENRKSKIDLICWDWGWPDASVPDIIARLPVGASLMSVSEWGMPIERGGVKSNVGEYSLSTIGPGPRALKHWEIARKRGIKTIAKIQAGNSWELSAVPYIPAVFNSAVHASNLHEAGIDGIMLGWTLGGYPSPNLEVISAIGRISHHEVSHSVKADLQKQAARTFGEVAAERIAEAWDTFSEGFRHFPFHIGTVYSAPLQAGPANLLWENPTGFKATMVGIPYDDLESWRSVYPASVFALQLEIVAKWFENGELLLRSAKSDDERRLTSRQLREIDKELNVAEACEIHFFTVASQSRFVETRDALIRAKTAQDATPLLAEIEMLLRDEIATAKRLHSIQSRDSRIGFEATNQYYYVPVDLAEKVLNCRDLLDRWLPSVRARYTSDRSPSGSPAK